MIDTKIFKAYDIRGIYPDQINEEAVENIAKGVYTFISQRLNKKNFTIVLGRDMRISSPSLHKVAAETLAKCGAKVIDIGLVTTPTVYFAVKHFSYDAGFQISASHNPKEYNGIKVSVRDGDAIVKLGKEAGLAKISQIIQSQEFAEFADGGEIISKERVLDVEVDQALAAVAPGDISKFRVVVDPANAMGILSMGSLFDKIDAKLIKMNFDLDGTFPVHQADPLQHKTLAGLREKVVEEKADFGIAIDGDSDRAMFIDEKGKIIPATLITTLIAGEILKESPGALILVDIRYIRNVTDIVRKMGGKVEYTKIGHALITKQVNDDGAVFAGESSGHYYFQTMGGCESTLRVVIYVLKVLARENLPISEIMQKLQTSVESGEVNFKLPEGLTSDTVVNKIKEQFKDGNVSDLDGIAIDYPDWRLSVRSSNTEPLIRLNVEGNSTDLVEAKKQTLTDLITGLGAHIEG